MPYLYGMKDCINPSVRSLPTPRSTLPISLPLVRGVNKRVEIILDTPFASWSLAQALMTTGVDVRKALDVVVVVKSITTGLMVFDALPLGSNVLLLNGGNIYGTRNGGTAIKALGPLIVVNQGTIAGGGGKGGQGANVTHTGIAANLTCDSLTLYGGSGGDGAGMSGSTYVSSTSGGSGTSASDSGARSGSGGIGGGLGQAGNSGGFGTNGSSSTQCGPYTGSTVSGYAGSPAGYYIEGDRFVTWATVGNRLGRLLK